MESSFLVKRQSLPLEEIEREENRDNDIHGKHIVNARVK